MCNVIQEGPGSQAIQDDEECVNEKGDQWCKSQTYSYGGKESFCQTEYRKKQCQKTCGVCESNECENEYTDDRCLTYTIYSTYPCMDEEQQKTCKKTCNLCSDYCEDVYPYYCLDYKIKETPYGCNNPKMMILCRKTCGYCPATKKVCPNEFTDDYCNHYKDDCKSDDYFKQKCKKTCKISDC